MRIRILFFLLLHFTASAQTDTLTLVAYNLLNFPDGRDDCGTNVVVPDRADTLRKILSYARPDIFVACEIQTEAGADSILTRSLNSFGAGNYAQADFHLNSNGSDLHNSLYYNTTKLTLQWQDYIQTSSRDIDHYVLYANDPNLGIYFDTTFIEVYMCHLKAGTGASNENARALQTEALMDYISLRPTNRNHIVCGDLNVYSSSEVCYQTLTTGANALQDPISSPGNWNNNAAFAAIHTQSTRSSGNYDCGATGGTDDRFDQILVSGNLMTGSDSLRYLDNSYKAIGNDGNHFNSSLLTAPSNTDYPDSVVRALFYMSDHMPVRLQMVANYPTSNGLALYPIVQAASCNGASDGTATIVANDGQAPYSYLWDANAGNQTTATATNLSSGSYCVEVTDDLGEVDTYCMYIPQPSALSYSTFVNPDAGTCTGSAYLIMSGGAAPYTISWNDPALQSGTSALNLCGGSYIATVTDANACTTEIFIQIGFLELDELYGESGFQLYPNPAKTDLHIVLPENFEGTSFALFNEFGQSIDLPFVQHEQEIELDTRSLESGMYFIRIVGLEDAVCLRFVK